MARTLPRLHGGALLPTELSETLAKRAHQFGGVALGVLALLLVAALVTYDPADPSLNHATSEPVANLLGVPGAAIADALLQSVGLAAGLIALVLSAWGWNRLAHDGTTHMWARFILLLSAIVLATVSFAVMTPPASWPLASGLGGVGGQVLLERLSAALAAAQAPAVLASDITIAIVAGVLSLSALIFALGLARTDWLAIGYGLLRVNDAIGHAILLTFDWVRDLKVGRTATVDAPVKPKPKRVRKVRKKPADLVAKAAPKPKAGKKAAAERQPTLDLGLDDGHALPPLDLLEEAQQGQVTVNTDALEQNATLLAQVLEDFGVRGEIVKVRPGPVITLYELSPAPGTKTSRVIGLSDDIARSMSAISVRVAVIPGKNVIGIELPNQDREMVHLRELLSSQNFEGSANKLNLALGKDIGGVPVMVDLARMPHLLIAGTTGSGKSVGVNGMILSLLYRMTPQQCRFIMIDPKMLELSVYDGIPHLLSPVVTDPGKAVVALKWAVREMEERYRAMSQMGVRNIGGYNARLAEASKKGETLTRTVQTGFDEDGKPVFEEQPLSMEPLPFIVVIVDEMADLMLVAGKDVEGAIQRLAQMARAAGIHLIMATQRPSVDVITGTIKANFPTRISFQVTSKIDSRTILGEQGAEQLLGQGDMLYMAGGGRITRVHAPFVSDEEVEDVVKHLKAQGVPDYVQAVTEEPADAPDIPGLTPAGGGKGDDALYDQAVGLVAREGKASTSFIQRHLQIGYNRAARIIEQMEEQGVVSKANRVGRREVLIGDVSEY